VPRGIPQLLAIAVPTKPNADNCIMAAEWRPSCIQQLHKLLDWGTGNRPWFPTNPAVPQRHWRQLSALQVRVSLLGSKWTELRMWKLAGGLLSCNIRLWFRASYLGFWGRINIGFECCNKLFKFLVNQAKLC